MGHCEGPKVKALGKVGGDFNNAYLTTPMAIFFFIYFSPVDKQ